MPSKSLGFAVSIESPCASEATLGTARLISGDDALISDPKATAAAGDLLDPIPAGKRATGELRFETAGALTSRLADQKRARLRTGAARCPSA